MTDKELFEKVSKEFNLNENTNISNVFDKGNFNKTILEIRKSSAPTGGGAFGNAFNAVRAMIPGTRAYDMRSAERDTAVAQARQEQLKAKKQQQELKGSGKLGQSEMSPELKKVYMGDLKFKNAYDKLARGEQLTSSEDADYKNGMKKVDAAIKGVDIEAGKQAAKKEIAQQTEKTFIDGTSQAAPEIGKFFRDPKNEADKNIYIKFLLQDDNYGKPTDVEIVTLATNKLTPIFKKHPNEVNSFTKYIKSQSQTKDPKVHKILFDNIPEGMKSQQRKPGGSKRSPKLSPRNVMDKLKVAASQAGRSLEEQRSEMIRQANRFRDQIGKEVKGTSGAAYILQDIDQETGMMTFKDKNNNNQYRFANQLQPPTQEELPLDSSEENFEDIIKRYR